MEIEGIISKEAEEAEEKGEYGLQRMVDTYHNVGEACTMQVVNPRIDPRYVETLSSSKRREPVQMSA